MSISSRERISNVIGFVGDTHVGKSSLICQLISSFSSMNDGTPTPTCDPAKIGPSLLYGERQTNDWRSIIYLRSMLWSDSFFNSLPKVAGAKQACPTTANINFFQSHIDTGSGSSLWMLDFEGENGGLPPIVELIPITFSLSLSPLILFLTLVLTLILCSFHDQIVT